MGRFHLLFRPNVSTPRPTLERVVKTKIYCTNSDCTRRHFCARYLSRPANGTPTRKYEEVWNGKPCLKFDPTVPDQQPSYLTIDEPMATKGRIQNPRDIELREHLVRTVVDHFDELFMQEMAWRSGTAYNVPQIAGRVVDLIMPIMKRSSTVRKYR